MTDPRALREHGSVSPSCSVHGSHDAMTRPGYGMSINGVVLAGAEHAPQDGVG